MEKFAEDIRKASLIIAKTAEDQVSPIMDLMKKKFQEENYEWLAKLNDFYEKGYITDNEYLMRLTSHLHQLMIAGHSPL